MLYEHFKFFHQLVNAQLCCVVQYIYSSISGFIDFKIFKFRFAMTSLLNRILKMGT